MRVKDYLQRFGKYEEVTMVIGEARKDANTPYYHAEYHTTSILLNHQWTKSEVGDFVILNHKQEPIDWLCGSNWKGWHEKGWLKCLLVISEDDLRRLYPGEQWKSIEAFCENKIKEDSI